MMKYLSFFRLRFALGLQYRTAALAGIATQFFWGFMEIMVFMTLYEEQAERFPITLSATVSYIWLQQAFLAFFNTWGIEIEIFDSIVNGNVSYELCRPINLYNMWFSRNIANRMSSCILRCVPILILAFILPEPYGISLPDSLGTFCLFIITLFLGLCVTVAFCMLIYMLAFFTISPQGLRVLFISTVEFLSGGVIPLAFLPDGLRQIVYLLPFASMQNVALSIYGGSVGLDEIFKPVCLQIFWLITITALGKSLCSVAQRKVCVQGG